MDGEILNPDSRPLPDDSADPSALSQRLLVAARTLSSDPAATGTLRTLTAALHHIDPSTLKGDAHRIAFWCNVYNALVKHAMFVERLSGNLLLKLGLFNRAAYKIGSLRYSLNLIEHGLLRGNKRPPASLFRVAGDRDPALRAAPSMLDPRIHFALNCGARSCPPIRAYEGDKLDSQLHIATRAYFDGEAAVDRARNRVTLPRLCKYYDGDFGGESGALRFSIPYLPDADREWVSKNANQVKVTFGNYDWKIVDA